MPTLYRQLHFSLINGEISYACSIQTIRGEISMSICIITRASVRKPESLFASVFVAKRGSWSQAFFAWTAKTGDESGNFESQ